jgi:hemerythrin
MVPWHSDYELGIEQIDTEHRHILNIINSLVPGDGSEIDSEMFGHVVDRLAIYVDRHFRSEEDVLHTAGYAGADLHMRSHNHFNARVNDWRGWDTKDIEGLHRSLVQWLIDHIQKEDSTFVPHVLNWLHQQKALSHSA